jgi:hypothetical protein
LAASGDQTAALAYGGYTTTAVGNTESWNGTSWTEVNDLNQVRNSLAGAGTSNTLALAFGGQSPSTPFSGVTQSWNGTSWSNVQDMNTARYDLAGGGSSTLALAAGGSNPGATAATEEWNGDGKLTDTFTTS